MKKPNGRALGIIPTPEYKTSTNILYREKYMQLQEEAKKKYDVMVSRKKTTENKIS